MNFEPLKGDANAWAEIRDIIGDDVAKSISERLGGRRIYVPIHESIESRNTTLREKFGAMLSEGSTCMAAYAKLSEETGLSMRWVQKVVNHE